MSRSRLLYNLQQLDSKTDRAQARIEEIETTLKESAVLEKALQEEKAAQEVLDEKRKALKKAEQEVESQQREIDQKTNLLYGGTVTSPKELEDLQQKVDSLKRYLGVLEERQLEAMLETDEAQDIHAQAAQYLDEIRADREALHKKLEQERTTLESEIEAYRDERPSLLPDIAPVDLALYEEVRKSRAGIAVAVATDQSCTACGTRLTSSLYQVARSPSQVAQCSTCKRILYVV